MRKQLIFNILIFSVHLVIAQDFPGIHTSRYFPLQNINNQPADLIRSDTRWNINVVSAQINMINNFVFAESNFVEKLSKVGFPDLKHFLDTEQAVLLARGKFLLPSVSYKINAKHAVGFSMNLRADAVYSSSNNELMQLFKGYNNPELLKDLEDEHFKSVVNQWTEYAFTWSGVLFKQHQHLLTGGVNAKYLVGGSSGYFNMDGISVDYDKEKIAKLDMNVNYAFNKNLDQAIDEGKIELIGNKGFGFDFGVSYSFKPVDEEDMSYKFKVGLTVNDLGYIKHSDDIKGASYSIAVADVPYSRFKGIETLEALMDSLSKSVDIEKVEGQSYKMELPTSFLINADYCLHPNWYISGLLGWQPGFYNSVIDIVDTNIFRWNLTPRFENATWGAYLPISYNTRLKTRIGLAMRWKYIFIGSGSIIGNLFDTEKGQGEIYFGINIPIGTVE